MMLTRMKDRAGGWLNSLLAVAGTAALVFACVAMSPSYATAAYRAETLSELDPKDADETKTDQVELIFRNGNVVKGTLISEDEGNIKVKVNIGGIEAETTYVKTDILAINRNLPAPGGVKKEEKKQTEKPQAAQTSIGDKPTVYFVEFQGEFGRDVSLTPIKEIVEDIRKHQPDYLVIKFNHTVRPDNDGEVREFMANMDGLITDEVAEQIGLAFYDAIYLDPAWEKKPELVGWVHRALGGAAYLPFVCPNLYYTSESKHGGLGILDRVFGQADEVVREKWRGAVLGGAQGMAIRGGYDPRYIRAMLRNDYVLSYKIESGKTVLLERMPQGPNEFLLTDDAMEDRRDSIQDVVRFKGNDTLMLDAELALRLGISKGTADTLDEVMFNLGVSSEYVVIKDAGDDIIEDWGKQITQAEISFVRLWRDYERAGEVKEPGTWREQNEAWGRQKNILKQIASLLRTYKESIDPQKIQGAPDNWMQQIDWMITQLENNIRRNRPR